MTGGQLGLERAPDGLPAGNVYYGTSSWTDRTLLASKRFYPNRSRTSFPRPKSCR